MPKFSDWWHELAVLHEPAAYCCVALSFAAQMLSAEHKEAGTAVSPQNLAG